MMNLKEVGGSSFGQYQGTILAFACRTEEGNKSRVPPEAGSVRQFDRFYAHTPEPVSFVAILISSVW
jgi:hypothetical protein